MPLGPRIRTRPTRKGRGGDVYTREKQYWIGGSPYSAWTVFSTGTTFSPFYERCEDVVSRPPFPENGLYIERCDLQAGYLSGIMTGPPPSSRQYRSSNWALLPNDFGDSETGHLAPLSWSVPSDYINRALARANPNRSDINLAQSIWELREIPAMLKHLGDLLSREGLTGAPIAYKFGWAPLVNDLKTLLNISAAIDKRMEMLSQLYRKEKRERFPFETQTTSFKSNRNILGLNYSYIRRTTLEVWAVKKHTIQGTPLSPAKPFTRSAAFWLAITEGTIETLWAVLPWSWLTDYFVGIADFLAATGNRIPGYTCTSLCIMHKLTTDMWHEVRHYSDGWSGDIKLKPLKGVRTSKRRLAIINPTSVFPTLKIITDGQLETLSALALAVQGRSKTLNTAAS